MRGAQQLVKNRWDRTRAAFGRTSSSHECRLRRCCDGSTSLSHGRCHHAWIGVGELAWAASKSSPKKPLIVLDGAHNPAGTKMLVETWCAFLAARFGWDENEASSRTRLIFASVADKDISETAQVLRPLAREVSLVRLANERTAEPRATRRGLRRGCPALLRFGGRRVA